MSNSNTTIREVLYKFVKENPGPAIIYFAALFLVPLYDVVLPHLYGQVVQSIQNSKPLFVPFMKVVFLIVFINLGVFISEWNETKNTYPALQTTIRKVIIEKLFKRHENDFDEQKTATFIAKITKLPNVIYNMVDQYKMVLVPQTLVIISIIVYFMMRDVILGTTMLVMIILIFAIITITPVAACGDMSTAREDSLNEIHEEIDDVLHNMMAVYNSNTLEKEDTHLDSFQTVYRNLSHDTQMCINKIRFVVIPISIALFAFFMWRCYTQLKRKKLDTGTFVSMFLIMMSLSSSLGKLISQIRDLVMRHGVLRASEDLLMSPFESAMSTWSPAKINTQSKSLQLQKPHMVIHFDQVTYKYPSAITPILDDVTLSIRHGDRIIIVGRIGTGKSTLLKLLMRYKTPTKGDIYLANRNYKDISTKSIRKTIGYVPQMPILFNRSIYDNIIYGLPEHKVPSKKELRDLFHTMELQHIFDNMKEGLDANVGKNGSKLSGGQRQIVWIMRVLLQDPDVLLMDEPTASIDEHTKNIVRTLLSKIMHGRTVIMVTHDSYLEKFASRIVRMENGKIVQDTPMEKAPKTFKTSTT